MNNDTVVLKEFDPFAINHRVRVRDADPDLFDACVHDAFGTAQLRMVPSSGSARLEGGEKGGSIQFGRPILSLQQGKLGLMALPQLSAMGSFYVPIRLEKHGPNQGARFVVKAPLVDGLLHHLDGLLHHFARIELGASSHISNYANPLYSLKRNQLSSSKLLNDFRSIADSLGAGEHGITQILEPAEGRLFDHGFGEGHEWKRSLI
jgi:hypothetical protein